VNDAGRSSPLLGPMGSSGVRLGGLILVNAVGFLAFAWPFLVPGLLGSGVAHEADAPWILAVLLVCLAGVLFVDLGRGGMGPKAIALLGVLGAAMVALRLPGFVAGFSAMFIVVLVAGNSFGPAFGFVLGAVGMFASGLFVGGLGPWLPFQMVAVGWVGLGAGLLPRETWRIRIVALALYGFAIGFLFGFVMNLWSWPFLAGGSEVGWNPSSGVAENLRRYVAYYAATSAAWDMFRAVGNAAMVLAMGRPLLGALDRAARRMRLEIATRSRRPVRSGGPRRRPSSARMPGRGAPSAFRPPARGGRRRPGSLHRAGDRPT
jgi:energy-coupling factor transport system substrate-specific component